MTSMEFFAQILFKSTVLLGAAFAVNLALRRAPAALRHFVWTAAMAAVLLLPALIAVAPHWAWRAAPVQAVETVTVRVHQVTRAMPARSVRQAPAPMAMWPLLLWAVGLLASGAHFLMGARRTARLVSGAAPFAGAEQDGAAPVLASAEVPMPMVCGIRKPVVLLPANAIEWPADRLRTVLLHERLHVERRDLLAQAVAQAACCFYWFHPLAWLAARQQRRDRERACDDAVLQRGVAAADYAAHLLALVRLLAARQTQWSGAAGMAEGSGLESRVRELLDRRRPRHPLSRRAAVLVSGAALAVLLPLATLTSYAQATSGGLTGVVRDPSGAVVPGCEVAAKNLDGTNEEVTRCDAAGQYRFASLPPGKYALECRARGFAVQKLQVAVTAGEVSRVDSQLQIGRISETVTVTGQKPATVSLPRTAAPAGGAQRIRVGGNVQMAQLLSQVKAVYPPDAQQQGVEGTVVIQAIISKTGEVLSPHVSNTVDARLAQAALDAVSKWRYSPTLLNGEPVEVITSIEVEFKLAP